MGNAGGYIGLILGCALINLPEMIISVIFRLTSRVGPIKNQMRMCNKLKKLKERTRQVGNIIEESLANATSKSNQKCQIEEC